MLELSGSAIKFLPISIAPISGDSDFVAISIGLVNRPPKKIVLSWISTSIQGSGLRVSDEKMKIWSVIKLSFSVMNGACGVCVRKIRPM